MKNILKLLILALLIVSCHNENQTSENRNNNRINVFLSSNCITSNDFSERLNNFAKSLNVNLNITEFADSYEIYEHLVSEDNEIKPDLILGFSSSDYWLDDIDNLLIDPSDVDMERIDKTYIFRDHKFVPYSFYNLAFVYNKELLKDPPITFGSMQDGLWKDKLILPDPRKTSIGRAMLIWSVATFGKNGYGHFWRSMKENIFRVTPTWDDAFRMFLAEEAPLILGYTSLSLYNAKNQIETFIPQEGGFRLIESAAITKFCQDKTNVQKIVNFLISDSMQAIVNNEHLGYSVLHDYNHNSTMKSLPEPHKYYDNIYSNKNISENFTSWIKKWEQKVR